MSCYSQKKQEHKGRQRVTLYDIAEDMDNGRTW